MSIMSFWGSTLLLAAIVRVATSEGGMFMAPDTRVALSAAVDGSAVTAENEEAIRSLLVCNAYVWRGQPLDVYRVRKLQRLTNLKPIAYKECQNFNVALKDGDQIDFKAGDLDVGTFYATGLPPPQNPEAAKVAPATLLLVPRRRDEESAAIVFESHAFAALRSAQVAVVDAYSGASPTNTNTVVRIVDADTEQAASTSMLSTKTPEANLVQRRERRSEDLRYNSVIAVNSGEYEVMLQQNSSIAVAALLSLNAQPGGRYVIMRVGDEAGGILPSTTDPTTAIAFPQELVVYPSTKSFAATLRVGSAVVVLVVCVAMAW